MSKSANKSSSRTSTLIDQIEKLVTAEKLGSTRDVEQLRHVTLRMQQMLQNQERGKKDMVKVLSDKIPFLLGLLESCNDAQLMINILSCVLELCSAGRRITNILTDNATIDILLPILKTPQTDTIMQEEIFVLTHSILAKVSHRDRKFSVKIRLTGALQVTLDVVKQNCSNFKVLHPALLVLKQSLTSAVNCNILNKTMFVGVLFKILPNCGHKRVTSLKLVLEVVTILLKSKNAAVKAVQNLNAVDLFIRMFNDWHRNDHHNRQTGVRKAVLNCIKTLVNTRVGRQAFVQADGFKTLFYYSNDTLDCKELDSVNNSVVQVLRLCMPVNKMPIATFESTVNFPLPKINRETEEGIDNNEKESDEDEISALESEEERITESQEDSEMSSSENTKSSSSLVDVSLQDERSKEEILATYQQFFQEMNFLKVDDVEKDEVQTTESRCQQPIVIPTGKMDVCSPTPSSSHLTCPVNCKPSDVIVQLSNSTNDVSLDDVTGDVTAGREANTRGAQKFKVRSVSHFVQVPAPDVYGHYPPVHPEPLNRKSTSLQRLMLLKNVERVIHADKLINAVVYDLDELTIMEDDEGSLSNITNDNTSSRDNPCDGNSSEKVAEVKASTQTTQCLFFESRFECGNLRKAIQIYETEYDLILEPDINCKGHHQWFYFEVSNMVENISYKFNIINCEKVNSQFNFGMQPVLYSTKDAENGDPGWIRTGSSICYYKNHYKTTKNEKDKFYYTATFTIEFPYSKDRCYLAYHYPYSFSLLESHLISHEYRTSPDKIYFKRQILCSTLTGNPCYVLTITSPSGQNANRPYIFLCSRVHPGESNSSWAMKGVLDFLLSNKITAKILREMFVFKLVPMLNPDGVINGCHRCSLSGADLNRQWINPDSVLYPTIYHTKGLLHYLQAMEKKPLVFCDFHGHSRKKNVFMYGCHTPNDIPVTIATTSSSVNEASFGYDTFKETTHRTLPRILHAISPAFSLPNCSYNIEACKEATARVVVWRQFGVVSSYTMENTYCGADQGIYKGYHLGTKELEEVGRCFCSGLLKLGNDENITRLLGTVSKSTVQGEQSLDEDEFNLFSNSDLFAPVSTFPYDSQEYATQLLV